METIKRKRTHEEVRAAFKEALRRKQEWIEESTAFLERIHQKRLAEQSKESHQPLNLSHYEQTHIVFISVI